MGVLLAAPVRAFSGGLWLTPDHRKPRKAVNDGMLALRKLCSRNVEHKSFKRHCVRRRPR